MPEIVFDIESRSGVNLHDQGAHIYSIDASTQPLCIVFAVDGDEPQLWLPSDPVPPVFFDIAADPSAWKAIAHNFDFEREFYENVLVPRYGFPAMPRSVLHCTQRMAMANAYPAELGLLSQALGLPYRKDPEARKALLAISRPKKQCKRKSTTAQPVWDEDPDKLRLVYERCKTRRSHHPCRLAFTKAQAPQRDRTRRSAPRHRNQRAWHSPRSRFRHRLRRRWRSVNASPINLKLQELTHGTITRVDQAKRFLEAINARGHSMTTLNKRAVAQVLAGQARRLCAPAARTAPRRSSRGRQQVQAHADLRLADRRPHARDAADVRRRPRKMERARSAAAEFEEERERSAAVRGRFHPRR